MSENPERWTLSYLSPKEIPPYVLLYFISFYPERPSLLLSPSEVNLTSHKHLSEPIYVHLKSPTLMYLLIQDLRSLSACFHPVTRHPQSDVRDRTITSDPSALTPHKPSK